MIVYSYNPAFSGANIGSIVKDSTEKPSLFVDWAGGLISGAVTVTTVTAVGLSSTSSTITTQVVGTISTTGTLTRLDLKTGGASGTSPAVDGNQYQIVVTCQPSSGGPLDFSIFVRIDAPTYGPV